MSQSGKQPQDSAAARITRRGVLASLAALFTACSPVGILNGLAARAPGYTRHGEIAYGNDPRQMLDVYQPDTRAGRAPVVLFFYGGSWRSGRRGDYLFVGEALASRGFVVVIADYRVYPQVRYPGFVEDSAAALAWTVEHVNDYGGDPQCVFVAGHSAGAYNAAMIALDPRWTAPYGIDPAQLRGFIGLAGPYNFLPITAEAVKPIFFFPDSPADSQPVAHVSARAPASLLLAARDDTTVFPDRNSEVLAMRLREVGASVELKIYDRVSHTTLIGALAWPLRGLAPVLDDMSAFIIKRSA